MSASTPSGALGASVTLVDNGVFANPWKKEFAWKRISPMRDLLCIGAQLLVWAYFGLSDDKANDCEANIPFRRSGGGPDLAWSEYLTSVYGNSSDMSRALRKTDVNIIYRNMHVAVHPLYWHHRRPLSALSDTWGDTYFHYSRHAYQRDEWAEVNRYSTYFLNSYNDRDGEWEEGLSRGFPGRSPQNETKVAYGCWLNLAKGSGIYVNVGKTLVTSDKYHSSLFQDLGLTSKGCLPTDRTGDHCYDRYICTAALARGYDSVQVTGRSEIVICSGKCATETLRYTCPPLELRSGWNATQRCDCSDQSHLLNCGSSADSIPDLRNNFFDAQPAQEGYLGNRHKVCVYERPPVVSSEPFEISLHFTAGALESLVPLPKVVSFMDAQKQPALLVDIGVNTGNAQGQSHGDAHESHRHRGEVHLAVQLRGQTAEPPRATPLGPFHRSAVAEAHLNYRPDRNMSAQRRLQDDHHYDHHRGHHHNNPDEDEDEDHEGRHHHHHHDHEHDHHDHHEDGRDYGHHHHWDHGEDRWAEHRDPHPSGVGKGENGHIMSTVARAQRALDQAKATGYALAIANPALCSANLGNDVDEIALLHGRDGCFSKARIRAVGGVSVGFIAHAPREDAVSEEEHGREYVDEAVCLRTAGAALVVLLGSSEQEVEKGLVEKLQGYIDVIVSGRCDAALICGRDPGNSTQQELLRVKVCSPSSLATVRIQRNADMEISLQSSVTNL